MSEQNKRPPNISAQFGTLFVKKKKRKMASAKLEQLCKGYLYQTSTKQEVENNDDGETEEKHANEDCLDTEIGAIAKDHRYYKMLEKMKEAMREYFTEELFDVKTPLVVEMDERIDGNEISKDYNNAYNTIKGAGSSPKREEEEVSVYSVDSIPLEHTTVCNESAKEQSKVPLEIERQESQDGERRFRNSQVVVDENIKDDDVTEWQHTKEKEQKCGIDSKVLNYEILQQNTCMIEERNTWGSSKSSQYYEKQHEKEDEKERVDIHEDKEASIAQEERELLQLYTEKENIILKKDIELEIKELVSLKNREVFEVPKRTEKCMFERRVMDKENNMVDNNENSQGYYRQHKNEGGEKCEVNREAMGSELAQQKPATRKELQNTDGHEQVHHREERRKDNSLHQVHEKLGSFLQKIRKSDELKIKTKCCLQTKRADTIKGDVLSEYRSQRSQYQETRTRFSEKIPSGQDEGGNKGNEKHDTYLSCTVPELFKTIIQRSWRWKEKRVQSSNKKE